MGAFVLGHAGAQASASSRRTWAAGSGRRSSSIPRKSWSPGLAQEARPVPVKWTATAQRELPHRRAGPRPRHRGEMGFDAGGKLAGLRVKTVANLGAYLSLFAPCVPTYLYGTLLAGLYDIPAIHCEVDGVFTHTDPVDAYRGAGRPGGLLPRRAHDGPRGARAGDGPGGDPPQELHPQGEVPLPDAGRAHVRQRQLRAGAGPGAGDRRLPAASARSRTEARKQGRYIGIGLSTYIEACGLAPSQVVGSLGAQAGLYESAHGARASTGKVTVFTGSHSHGQGHETTFAQLAADALGIPMSDVEIVHGDTGQRAVRHGHLRQPQRRGRRRGRSHGDCRRSSRRRRRSPRTCSRRRRTTSSSRAGKFSVKGSPDRAKTFGDVALAAYLAHNMPPGWSRGWRRPASSTRQLHLPFGTHIAWSRWTRDTGAMKLRATSRWTTAAT